MKKNRLLVLCQLLFSMLMLGQIQSPIKENCQTVANKDSKTKKMETTQKNVLGTNMELASIDPMTGFFRTGYCSTDASDRGLHVVAAVVTDKFLQYSLSKGNDLISPYPLSGFPGLKSGDIWCLCVLRWREALEAGVAPLVILEATNIKALAYVTLEQLKSKRVE